MSDILDKLIYMLCEERGEKMPKVFNMPRGDFFRALCNVRPPKEASEEFIALQDEYLSDLAQSKGIVDVAKFEYINGVSVWQGDITRLNSNGIVNACNCALLGCFQPLHNCIDNAIHSAAGVQVRLDCNNIMGGRMEPNGQVKVTDGYNLPSRYIFHTVGPIVSGRVTKDNERDLKSCYISCMDKAEEMGLESLAFCCISTGVYGYPKKAACKVAVSAVLDRIAEGSKVKVIFNVFGNDDRKIYLDELKSRGITFKTQF
jgi:O-acetyl-ADP-ribose deacetylase (regulator of RNase III)